MPTDICWLLINQELKLFGLDCNQRTHFFLFLVIQAKSKGAVISQFSTFVNSVINEQEDIAHKLLGVQFMVKHFIEIKHILYLICL